MWPRNDGSSPSPTVLGRRRARLRELAGDPPDLDDRQRGAVGEHGRHLQHDLQLLADVPPRSRGTTRRSRPPGAGTLARRRPRRATPKLRAPRRRRRAAASPRAGRARPLRGAALGPLGLVERRIRRARRTATRWNRPCHACIVVTPSALPVRDNLACNARSSPASSRPATSTSATTSAPSGAGSSQQDEADCVLPHRRPARDHRSAGAGRPARVDARPRGAAHRLRPRPRRSHALRPEPRARASAPRLGARVHDAVRRRCAACRSSGRSRRSSEHFGVGLLTYPVLQAADILLYQADRRPGRRGPAPAPRARPRPRAALQPPLRRDVRRPRGHVPGGRREDHGPPGADEPHVDHGRRRRRHRCACSTRPTSSGGSSARRSPTRAATSSAAPDKPGVTNLIEIMAVGDRREPRGDRGALRRRRATARSRRTSPKRWSRCSTRSGCATRSCAAIPASCARSSRAAPRRRTRIAAETLTQAYERVGFVAAVSARSRSTALRTGATAPTAAPLTRRLVAGLVDWMIVTVFFLIAQIPLGVLQATGDEIGGITSWSVFFLTQAAGLAIVAGYFAFFFSTGHTARDARSGHPRRRGGDRPEPCARARRTAEESSPSIFFLASFTAYTFLLGNYDTPLSTVPPGVARSLDRGRLNRVPRPPVAAARPGRARALGPPRGLAVIEDLVPSSMPERLWTPWGT